MTAFIMDALTSIKSNDRLEVTYYQKRLDLQLAFTIRMSHSVLNLANSLLVKLPKRSHILRALEIELARDIRR